MMQETYFGNNSIRHLPDIILKYRAKKVFVVTGGDSFSTSGIQRTVNTYLAEFELSHYGHFSNNLDEACVERGLELYKLATPDLIIGIGGGSVIDMAKLLRSFGPNGFGLRDQISSLGALKYSKIPLIAIPTTAGAGSQATQFATIYLDRIKHSIASELLLPDIAIVDPNLTNSLSPYLTAIGGMDAMCQAIESYWSIRSNAQSRNFARASIRSISKELINAVHRKTRRSRYAMAEAAHLSGKAINITKTTAPHAISYPLTAHFAIPHGHAVALTLPSFLLFNYGVTEHDLNDSRGVAFVRSGIEEVCNLLTCRSPEEASQSIIDLMGDIGLATSYHGMNLDRDTVKKAVLEEVDMERLLNNPRMVSKESLATLLDKLS